MKYFHLIWKNVFRKKTRTVLTASSIVLVLVADRAARRRCSRRCRRTPPGARARTGSSSSTRPGSATSCPSSQRQRIEQIPGVVAVTPEIWFGGVYKDDKPENWIGQLSADPDIYFDKIFDDATIDPAGQRRVEGDPQRLRRRREASRRSSAGRRATTSS